MSKLSDLKNHASFPGAFVNIMEEFDARLKALEAHAPMLDELKPHYEADKAQRVEAEAAEQPPAEQPPAEQPTPEGTQS